MSEIPRSQSAHVLGQPRANLDEEYRYSDPLDPSVRFFYSPHTISVLVIILLYFLLIALYGTADHSSLYNSIRHQPFHPEFIRVEASALRP